MRQECAKPDTPEHGVMSVKILFTDINIPLKAANKNSNTEIALLPVDFSMI